jgi:acyl-CoA reductase-like NAD-dependent aldehyde dehydrogenase
MIRKLFLTLTGAAVLTTAAPVFAADFKDKTWPCIQRKVSQLSIGQMWTGPLIDESTQPDAEATALARAIAVRRTSLEDAQALIQRYADALGDDREEKLALLFRTVFEQINRERADVIGGISRYAAKQIGLSERIDGLQQELAALEAKGEEKSNDEWDRMEELQDIVTWDARIYTERAQSLTFVCETPVLLEKRAFALAKAFSDASGE